MSDDRDYREAPRLFGEILERRVDDDKGPEGLAVCEFRSALAARSCRRHPSPSRDPRKPAEDNRTPFATLCESHPHRLARPREGQSAAGL